MPRTRVTGLGGGNAALSGSISWEYLPSDADLARRIVLFLEDRRVLFAHEGREDYEECRKSADGIWKFLTIEVMNTPANGHLEKILNTMRTASREFVSAAGSNSLDFRADFSYFSACLSAYRDAMGRQLGILELDYKVHLASVLKEIVPPSDPRPFMSNARHS